MQWNRVLTAIAVAAALLSGACSTGVPPAWRQPSSLKDLVGPIQQSVVTVINYDVDGDVASIGSGFFIAQNGTLLTNYHVLEGAYHAVIRTMEGSQYPVAAVLAANRLVDLITVRVDIPAERATAVVLAKQAPAIAETVFVIGSPLGLEQTVSEGIISAIREMPTGGKVYQLTAPISSGSSGGPVINQNGEAIGVVTFQATRGQNLNFAISTDTLDRLSDVVSEMSIAEWTIRNTRQGPALAASLCSKGARLTIQGAFEEALTYFKKATEANPDDSDAWYGLGSCYVGLNQPEAAIAAYQRPIEQNPDNAEAHFILAMYYKTIGQYEQEVSSLLEVLRIDPANVRARFELGGAYGELERFQDQIDAFNTILADRPDHLATLLSLAMALAETGRLEEAMGLFAQARGIEPDNAVIHYNIGVTHNRMHQPEAAIRAYTHAIRANPRMEAAHYNLGMTYLDQDQRRLALGQYEILSGLRSTRANALFEKIYPESAR